ncbi:MAG: tyrosine-type recombinase/integrase [Candidatus Acidiferrales bacterium]
MARTVSSKDLGTRTARRAIPIGSKIMLPLSHGRALGYRKGSKWGVWLARFDADGFRKEEKLGLADDILDAEGTRVLDFAQAQEKARTWFLSATTLATGEHVSRRGGYTVNQCCQDYLKHLDRRGAPDYRHTKYDLDAYAIPKLGVLQVAKLTRPKLEEWRADIAASPRRTNRKHKQDIQLHIQTEEDLRKRRATANRIMRRLRAALNLALEEGRVYANPMAWKVLPFENVEVARGIFLSEKDQRTFVKACAKENDFQSLVRAGLYTGARYGELGRLGVGDFNSSASTLFIAKSKGGQQRYIHLDPEAMRFFREVCANRDPADSMLLRESGEPWAKDSQKKPMRRACTLAKMKRFGFHQLRHSAASRWITLGVSLKVVAEQLGHVDTKMVERYYGHLASGHIAQTFRGLPGVGLDKAAKVKANFVIPMPTQRSALLTGSKTMQQ